MPADPKDRSKDPQRALRRIFRVRDGLRALRMLLGLLVLLFIASLVGASSTADPSSLYLHMTLWALAQLVLIALSLFVLRALRARRFGAVPSTRIRDAADVLLHIDATLGGLVALLGFGPQLALGGAPGIDWLIAGIGLVLLLAGLRGAVMYVRQA